MPQDQTTRRPQPSHWAFQAAEALARRVPQGSVAVLETGYGPSGPPHMGTVAEVLRTVMVARAYAALTGGRPVRLISVTDDMDGLRRVPEGVPAAAGMERCIGMPLCDIPDPLGVAESYAAANAGLLRSHLRHFGLDAPEPAESLQRLLREDTTGAAEVLCVSASGLYRGGHYDAAMVRAAAAAPAIMDVVLPELGAERRSTWCPFVPVHRGRAVAAVRDWHLRDTCLVWTDEEGARQETSILGGGCKLQWRVDWSSRWTAFGVDFEMHGKDLMDSVRLGTRIAPLLGGRAPQMLRYELFLDEEGGKISKSVGNGIGMDAWRQHVPRGAFWHFLQRDPRPARRVGPQTLPQAAEDWLVALGQGGMDAGLALIHPDGTPAVRSRLGFSTILAVAAMADAAGEETVWRLLEGYDPAGVDRTDTLLAEMVACAVRRNEDTGGTGRTYAVPDAAGRAALADLAATLLECPADSGPDDVQAAVYEAGKRHGGKEGLKAFFALVYSVLLGKDHGPRLGTLAEAVGVRLLAAKLQARLEAS